MNECLRSDPISSSAISSLPVFLKATFIPLLLSQGKRWEIEEDLLYYCQIKKGISVTLWTNIKDFICSIKKELQVLVTGV